MEVLYCTFLLSYPVKCLQNRPIKMCRMHISSYKSAHKGNVFFLSRWCFSPVPELLVITAHLTAISSSSLIGFPPDSSALISTPLVDLPIYSG